MLLFAVQHPLAGGRGITSLLQRYPRLAVPAVTAACIPWVLHAAGLLQYVQLAADLTRSSACSHDGCEGLCVCMHVACGWVGCCGCIWLHDCTCDKGFCVPLTARLVCSCWQVGTDGGTRPLHYNACRGMNWHSMPQCLHLSRESSRPSTHRRGRCGSTCLAR